MLTNEILRYLYSVKIKDYVIEAGLTRLFEEMTEQDINKVLISDVRSATFYACGLSQKNDCAVALVVRKESLSNTFTGLTEAWFQRRCIIVIAIGNDIVNYPLNSFIPCTGGYYKILNQIDFVSCYHNISANLPSLLLVNDYVASEVFPYDTDIKLLANSILQNNQLFIYSPVMSARVNRGNIHYIRPEDKYGTIAKFLGHCISGKGRSVLLTCTSMLKLEMNIFNSRYIDDRFNLIIVGEKPLESEVHWIQSNGITATFSDSVENAGKEVLKSNKATVIFVVTLEGQSTCTQTL